MTVDKPVENSSVKEVLSVLQKKKTLSNIDGFLAAYRPFFEKGVLCEKLSPVINAFDCGELKPTQAIAAISSILILNEAVRSERAAPTEEASQDYPYIVRVYDKQGNQLISYKKVVDEKGKESLEEKGPMQDRFKKSQEATQWAALRVTKDAPIGGYAVVEWIHSEKLTERIDIDKAQQILNPRRAGMVTKRQGGVSSSNIGNRMRVKQSHSSFSRG